MELRGYFWGNMYLSSIQQGIQSAHCLGDMFMKYNIAHHQEKTEMLHDWAANHKTMILLNGGYSETLRGLLQLFDDKKNEFPYAYFNEGDDALDGALTCVGIILPESIYQAASLQRNRKIGRQIPIVEIGSTGQLVVEADENSTGEQVTWNYNSWDAKLIEELNKYSLAH